MGTETLEFFRILIAIIIGAASAGIPLWYKVRKLDQKLKEGEQELKSGDLKLRTEEIKVTQKDKINTEAEWKRIIEFRDAELVRLRERDDQQERQITTLWEKHVECERAEAAQAAKIEGQNEKIKSNEDRIKTLEARIDELLRFLMQKKEVGS